MDHDDTSTPDTLASDRLRAVLDQLRARGAGRRPPTITRVRGDKAHPGSQGYTCEKGLRVDHYQNDPHRLTSRCAAVPTARSRRSTGTRRSPRSRPASPR